MTDNHDYVIIGAGAAVAAAALAFAIREAVRLEAERLEAEEPDFLLDNHKIDIDYFDLIELPHKNLP